MHAFGKRHGIRSVVNMVMAQYFSLKIDISPSRQPTIIASGRYSITTGSLAIKQVNVAVSPERFQLTNRGTGQKRACSAAAP
jgi:hypothetical protein